MFCSEIKTFITVVVFAGFTYSGKSFTCVIHGPRFLLVFTDLFLLISVSVYGEKKDSSYVLTVTQIKAGGV